jgi:hypothetical protein
MAMATAYIVMISTPTKAAVTANAMTGELRSAVTTLWEAAIYAIYVTSTKPAAKATAATRLTAKIVTKRPMLVKASVSRKIAKNATATATAYHIVTRTIVKSAMATACVRTTAWDSMAGAANVKVGLVPSAGAGIIASL